MHKAPYEMRSMTLLQRGIAATGGGTYDVMQTLLVIEQGKGLERVLAKLKGETPPPVLPAICTMSPHWLWIWSW